MLNEKELSVNMRAQRNIFFCHCIVQVMCSIRRTYNLHIDVRAEHNATQRNATTSFSDNNSQMMRRITITANGPTLHERKVRESNLSLHTVMGIRHALLVYNVVCVVEIRDYCGSRDER